MERELKKLDPRLTYSLDLDQDLADLVFYANRMNPYHITSLRISHRYRWPTPHKIDYILRGAEFPMQDINRPPWAAALQDRILEVVEYHNYIMIHYEAENNGWVGGPEGNIGSHKLRWFHRNAPFTIFPAKEVNSMRHLHFTLSPGPDLTPENGIRVFLETGETFEIENQFGGKEQEIVIPLPPKSNQIPVKGQIEVLGPQNGLKQLRVRNIFVETKGVTSW